MDACSCDGTRLEETFAVLTCAPRDASQTLLLVVCLLSAFTYASAGLLVQIGSADGSLPVGEFTLARGLLQTAAAGLLLRGERGNAKTIRASVPLANMFQYVSTLRSISKGRASYSMKLASYDFVPPNVEKELMAKFTPSEED